MRRARVAPAPGEIEIAVHHAGVCFGDILIANRARGRGKPDVVPGMETAGIVARVGNEDSPVKVGQRVVAYGTSGGYASHVVRRVTDVFPLPDGVETSDAVALPVNYVTALQSLRLAGASQGQTLFFNAASGGVGTAIADLAREQQLHAIGAASARKHERLRELNVIPVDPERESFDGELATASASGINLALDGLGLGWEKRCMSLVGPSGKVVSYGIRGVGRGSFPFAKVMVNQLSFVLGGFFSRKTARLYILELSRRRRPAEYRADMLHLIELVQRRRLRPIIAAEIPLERAADAHRTLAARDLLGKIVLRVE